jgi:hypothetical protein
MICDMCKRPEESHPCHEDVNREAAENAKLRAEVTDLKQERERIAECHTEDMRHLVARTRERDAALIQNRAYGRLYEAALKYRTLRGKNADGSLSSALIDAWVELTDAIAGCTDKPKCSRCSAIQKHLADGVCDDCVQKRNHVDRPLEPREGPGSVNE